MTIRQGAPGDARRIAELWSDLLTEQHELDNRFAPSDDAVERWLNDYREWVEATDIRRIVVAESEGELVGFASAQLWWPPMVYEQVLEVYLDELYVSPAHRRRGIGSQLLDDIAQWARSNDVTRIRLGSLAANSEGIEFWKKRGATEFVVALLLDC